MKFNKIGIGLLLVLHASLQTVSAAAAPGILTLNSFIQTALTNNPELQNIRAQWTYTRAVEKKALAVKQLLLAVTAGYSYTDPVYSGTTVSSKQNREFETQVSLSKKFPSLFGSSVSVSMSHTGSSSRATDGTKSTVNSPSFGVAFSVPLLRNTLGKIDRNTLSRMHLALRSADHVRDEAYELLLKTLYTAYLEWQTATEQSIIIRQQLGLAQALYGQTARKFQLRIADDADLMLARRNWLSYSSSLVNAEQNRLSAWITLNALMSGKPVKNPRLPLFQPETVKMPQIVLSNVDQSALRSVRIAKLNIDSTRLDFNSAQNNSKPELNLLLSGAAGGPRENFADSFSAWNKQSMYAGLEFSMPLQHDDAKENVKAQSAALQQALATYRQLTIQLAATVQNSLQSINKARQLTELAKDTEGAAGARSAAMYRKYLQGRVSLEQLTDARNAYASARVSRLEYRLKLQKLLIEYAALTDQLLPLHRIF